MRKIILIWWAPTTWKTTLAKNLSKILSIPWISTDKIRAILKIYANKEKKQKLFLPKWYETAKKFLEYFSAQEISDMEFKQAEEVWPWIEAFLYDNYGYWEWIIIEWVWIVPELINKHTFYNKDVFPIFIYDDNKERTRKVIFERWLFEDAKNYPDDLKEKEIEWVEIFTDRIKKQCNEYNLKCMEFNKNDNDTKKILDEIEKYFKIE